MPEPFAGINTLGSGKAAAAIDAYGTVVDLRAPGPGGEPLIEVPFRRQRAGSVPADTGIVISASGGRASRGGAAPVTPLWRADAIRQDYVRGSNVLRTRARVAGAELEVLDATSPERPALVRRINVSPAPAGSRGRHRARAATRGDRVRRPSRTRRAGRPTRTKLRLDVNLNHGGAERRVQVEPDRQRFTIEAGGGLTECRFDALGNATRLGEKVRLGKAERLDGDAGTTMRVEATDHPGQVTRLGGKVRIEWGTRGSLTAEMRCGLAGAEPPRGAAMAIASAIRADRAWLKSSRGLAPSAPVWARRLYARSLLVLRAHVDPASGAVPAALRDFWDFTWPRDAATVALALSEAGHTAEADAIARFLGGLDVGEAARFTADGQPVADGREPQGDGVGWQRVARRAAATEGAGSEPSEWRDRGDYAERSGERGDYLANAIAAGAPAALIEDEFGRGGFLTRESGSSELILDTAAAWAVRPFNRPALAEPARNTLLRLAAGAGPYGLTPSSDWPGESPWTAATATVAWGLAGLGERGAATGLMRRIASAATPVGLLPERVDSRTGAPLSATPLAWSHALAALTLRELWPDRAQSR